MSIFSCVSRSSVKYGNKICLQKHSRVSRNLVFLWTEHSPKCQKVFIWLYSGCWFVLINISFFIPIHVTAPYIRTNVSTLWAVWKVFKCEVLFWISSGSFWMKYNILCKVKKIKLFDLVLLLLPFLLREEFSVLEKEDTGMT